MLIKTGTSKLKLMKQFILLLLQGLIITTVAMAQTLAETIVFEQRVHSFGTIKEADGKVSYTFVFKNNGKTPVTISSINSGCGCIGNAVSKKPVPAGGKGQVTVTFNPEYKSGFFSKEIVVMSNNDKAFNRVWVEGTIIPSEKPIEHAYPYNFGSGLYLRLEVMAFGYVKAGTTKQMELHYANATDKEMILGFVVEDNKGNLVFKSPGKIGAKAKGITSFSFTMPYLGNEDVTYKVYPYVNNKKLAKPVTVKVLNELNFKNKADKPAVVTK